MHNLAISRLIQLENAETLHEFYRDVANEKTWIKEKESSILSHGYGQDLTSIQNLLKKHKRLEIEIDSHEPSIQSIREIGKKLTIDFVSKSSEIMKQLEVLNKSWAELKELVTNRDENLRESLSYYKYVSQIESEESWLIEKQQILSSENYGDNLASVRELLRKHESFEMDLKARNSGIIRSFPLINPRIERNDTDRSKIISQRCQELASKFEKLTASASIRKLKLLENLHYFQFVYKADMIDSYIDEKENRISSEKLGQNLKTVKALIANHKIFVDGLQIFEQDNIDHLTILKDKLVEVHHEHLRSIVKRHRCIIKRWKNLREKSQERTDQLNQTQDSFIRVENLYLSFASKASKFNSWFETAEEDLTDPVRCKSIEEIKALKDAQDHFEKSLKSKKDDLKELISLNRQLEELKVGPNPFTWFNLEYLMDSWRNLEKILRERDIELRKETLRQEENDLLRKEFAKHANEFHLWLVEARSAMMEGSGTLEHQLDTVLRKTEEVNSKETDLKVLEDLNASLQERLILDNLYTEHSSLALAQQWDQLKHLCLRMQHNLEQQIQAKNHSGVSEDALKEFSMIFKYYDKEQSGKLNHRNFKSCLRALGYDLLGMDSSMNGQSDLSMNSTLSGQFDFEFEMILGIRFLIYKIFEVNFNKYIIVIRYRGSKSNRICNS